MTMQVFKPEDYGAIGNGIPAGTGTNDSQAFARMSAAVRAAGGGVISLSPKIYIVGEQGGPTPNAWRNTPVELIHLVGLTRGVIILGNGAILKCATDANLKFGSFDENGQNAGLQSDGSFRSTPYRAMIYIEACAGPIRIQDVELDGSMTSLVEGGDYNQTGKQIDCDGIWLNEPTGRIVLSNIYTHHHGRDGLHVRVRCDAENASVNPLTAENVVSEYNARQGLSLVGGRFQTYRECKFNYTGKATGGTNGGFWSLPGAGIDIEPEATLVRDITFDRCEAIDNIGVGLVSTEGSVARNVTVRDSRIVGTTNFATFVLKPGFTYDGCTFVGECHRAYSNVRLLGDGSQEVSFDQDSTYYTRCLFTDDPALSPSTVFGSEPGGYAGYALNLGVGEKGVIVKDSSFELKGRMAGPFFPQGGALLENIRIDQAQSVNLAQPIAVHQGHNLLRGPIYLGGSFIDGYVRLNGAVQPLSPR